MVLLSQAGILVDVQMKMCHRRGAFGEEERVLSPASQQLPTESIHTKMKPHSGGREMPVTIKGGAGGAADGAVSYTADSP